MFVVLGASGNTGKVVAETLPAYAPELNPAELVWGWSKHGRLANLAAADTGWLRDHVIGELVDCLLYRLLLFYLPWSCPSFLSIIK